MTTFQRMIIDGDSSIINHTHFGNDDIKIEKHQSNEIVITPNYCSYLQTRLRKAMMSFSKIKGTV